MTDYHGAQLHYKGPEHVTAATLADVKVGTTLWRFDPSRRGYIGHKLVQRAHYAPVVITGETRQSWLMANGDKIEKPGPNSLTREDLLAIRGDSYGAFYLLDIDEHLFVQANIHKVAEALPRCKNAAVLRQIAALLNVDVED